MKGFCTANDVIVGQGGRGCRKDPTDGKCLSDNFVRPPSFSRRRVTGCQSTHYDPRPRTDEALLRSAARPVRGPGRNQFSRPAGASLRPAGPQRRGQDDDLANPQHRASSDRRLGHDRRFRRGRPRRGSPPPHRLHVGQHGGLRPHDRLGNGRVFRPAARHSPRRSSPSGWKPSSIA